MNTCDTCFNLFSPNTLGQADCNSCGEIERLRDLLCSRTDELHDANGRIEELEEELDDRTFTGCDCV